MLGLILLLVFKVCSSINGNWLFRKNSMCSLKFGIYQIVSRSGNVYVLFLWCWVYLIHFLCWFTRSNDKLYIWLTPSPLIFGCLNVYICYYVIFDIYYNNIVCSMQLIGLWCLTKDLLQVTEYNFVSSTPHH
jgi:hypothetical protein